MGEVIEGRFCGCDIDGKLKLLDEYWGITKFREIRNYLDEEYHKIEYLRINDKYNTYQLPYMDGLLEPESLLVEYVGAKHPLADFFYKCKHISDRLKRGFLYSFDQTRYFCSLCQENCEITEQIEKFFEDRYTIFLNREQLQMYFEYVEFNLQRGFIGFERFIQLKKEPLFPIGENWLSSVKIKKILSVC